MASSLPALAPAESRSAHRPPLRPSSREAILDAAEAVVLAAGAAHLTLDAVAEQAGVSKGGLLYNFPSKEALLQGMIDRHMRRVAQDHAAALAELPPNPGNGLKAFVQMSAQHSACTEQRLGSSMFAVCANNPKLLEPIMRFHQWRLEIIEQAARDGMPFERVAAVSLALDGLALLEKLGLSPFDETQRRRILEGLAASIDEMSGAIRP